MVNFGPLVAEICWQVWAPSKIQRVMHRGSITARHSSSGRQPNFAALNRRCHLYSTGWPSLGTGPHSSCIMKGIVYKQVRITDFSYPRPFVPKNERSLWRTFVPETFRSRDGELLSFPRSFVPGNFVPYLCAQFYYSTQQCSHCKRSTSCNAY